MQAWTKYRIPIMGDLALAWNMAGADADTGKICPRSNILRGVELHDLYHSINEKYLLQT